MVNEEDLKKYFGDLGVYCISKELADRCLELCVSYGINEEELVSTWIAFSISHLEGANPTLETLAHMERRMLKKKKDQPQPLQQSRPQEQKLCIYNGEEDSLEPVLESNLEDVFSTPKAKKRGMLERLHTPDYTIIRPAHSSPKSVFSPVSFSPTSATPSSKYNGRTNKGYIICAFGRFQLATDWQRKWENEVQPEVKLLPPVMDANSSYMYSHLSTIVLILKERTRFLKNEILAKILSGKHKQEAESNPEILFGPETEIPIGKKILTNVSRGHKLEAEIKSEPGDQLKSEPAAEIKFEPGVKIKSEPVPELKLEPGVKIKSEPVPEMKLEPGVKIKSELVAEVTSDDHEPEMEIQPKFGMVCSETDERLDGRTLSLECIDTKNITRIKIDSRYYSFFPGQVVGVIGGVENDVYVVSKTFFDASLPPPEPPSNFSTEETGPIQIVVAAGPFTQSDTMNYQPLEDLLKYVKENEPHVLILIGPFVDVLHPQIVEGMLAETYMDYFEKMVENFMEPLKELKTHVVLVPSYRDAHHHVIYPVPPFTLRKRYKRLTLASDPCMLDIQGIIVGVTSTDVLMHLGKEELARRIPGSDRLGRLASYILDQRSFYPLYPPAEDVNIDMELWEKHVSINVSPHILILPSDLRCFIKNLSGTVTVNPERLAKGLVGGNFSRIQVSYIEKTLKISGEVLKI